MKACRYLSLVFIALLSVSCFASSPLQQLKAFKQEISQGVHEILKKPARQQKLAAIARWRQQVGAFKQKIEDEAAHYESTSPNPEIDRKAGQHVQKMIDNYESASLQLEALDLYMAVIPAPRQFDIQDCNRYEGRLNFLINPRRGDDQPIVDNWASGTVRTLLHSLCPDKD